MITGDCEKCGRFYVLTGRNARRLYRDLKAALGSALCVLCARAWASDYYVYSCEGCTAEVSGSFAEVKSLLNCFGKAFCFDCRAAFYGRYNDQNEAMTIAITFWEWKRSHPNEVSSAALQRVLENETNYQKRVRALSRRNMINSPDLVNPKRLLLGRAGMAGAHHLDHIVPITVCFEANVPIEIAAAIPNLQIIPWSVNVSRNNKFDPTKLIGYPPSGPIDGANHTSTMVDQPDAHD